MSSRIKWYDLPGQGIGPALPTLHFDTMHKSSLIPKNHHIWEFQLLIPHKQNPHTKINQLAVTAKIVSKPGIQLCVASVAVQPWQTDFHRLYERLTWLFTFMSHLNTDHTCDLPEIRTTFQLHYGTVKQGLSQEMCKCLATGSIARCMHAVQQCGCKIIHREKKWCLWWHCYTVW